MVKPGHILFIVENNTVPFDRRVTAEVLAAQEFGHEVSVICPFDRNRRGNRDTLDGIRIFRHPRPIEGLGKWTMILEYLNAWIWEFFLSIRIFIERPFKVIHAANPPDLIFPIAMAFKLAGVKFIFDHHDLTPETYIAKYGTKRFLHKVLLWLERRSLRAADLVISTNESYKKITIERGGKDPQDVVVVRNGPDLATMPAVSPDPGLLAGFRHLIGYVGIIGKQEGLENLLEAAGRIVKKRNRPDVKFAIVGTGPHLANLVRETKARGLERNVQFFGYVPDRRLYEILTTADVCVNPEFRNDFTDKSTMIKIMEYMSFRKPIVQFQTTESEFTAGDAAIHVRNNDVIQFADAILDLLDDPARREKMGEIGRRRIEDVLSWQIQKQRLKMAYDRALGPDIP